MWCHHREEDSSETGAFSDWLEQFEAVATLAGWDEYGLPHNSPAPSFFHSCASKQQSDYSKQAFTAVELIVIRANISISQHR